MASTLPPVRPDSADSARPDVSDADSSEAVTNMPMDFYRGVDALLAKPPPSLQTICKPSAELPVLRKQRADLRNGGLRRTKPQADPSPELGLRRAKPQVADPSPELVQQALQYCAKLANEKLSNDPVDAPRAKGLRRPGGRPNKPPRDPYAATTTTTTTKRGPVSSKGATDRQVWSCRGENKAAATPVVAQDDIQRLVHNFETGAHLTELRRQLHESQKSLDDSTAAIAHAARDWQARTT